jgi:hypothetical protein
MAMGKRARDGNGDSIQKMRQSLQGRFAPWAEAPAS